MCLPLKRSGDTPVGPVSASRPRFETCTAHVLWSIIGCVAALSR